MQKVLVLHDFMLKDSKLKGSRLLVYAFIYSYAQIPDSSFNVLWFNACNFLGISKSSYFEAIQWLIDNKYIRDNHTLHGDNRRNEIYEKTINEFKATDLSEVCRKAWKNLPKYW